MFVDITPCTTLVDPKAKFPKMLKDPPTAPPMAPLAAFSAKLSV